MCQRSLAENYRREKYNREKCNRVKYSREKCNRVKCNRVKCNRGKCNREKCNRVKYNREKCNRVRYSMRIALYLNAFVSGFSPIFYKYKNSTAAFCYTFFVASVFIAFQC